jgi:hypothetical protein
MRYRIREALEVATVGKVDRDGHVVNDVRVCGLKSGNGREYSRDALRNAVQLYEGSRVYFDHPEGKSNARQFRERFGRLKNVRAAEDGGLIANLHYNPAHPLADQFLYLAENDPANMGLSHNAEGSGRKTRGGVLVESITKVHSVDIVDGPATNYSLFEQLTEQDMDPLTDPAAPPADTAAPAGGDDIIAKIQDLIASFAGHPEMDEAAKLKQIKALLGVMHDDGADKAEDDKQSEPAEGESAEKEPTDDEMVEQLGRFKSPAVRKARRQIVREQRRKQAVAKGLAAEVITETFLEQLVDAPAAKVDALIADRKAVAVAASVEKPRNRGGDAKPLTPKEIAATIDWSN